MTPNEIATNVSGIGSGGTTGNITAMGSFSFIPGGNGQQTVDDWR